MFVVVPVSLLVQHVTFECVREVLSSGLVDWSSGSGAVYVIFEVELGDDPDLSIN